MEFTPAKLTSFLFFKIPSAYWSGVRVRTFNPDESTVQVKHSWFNQNPFRSMYFAVQAMAAELSTGVLVMYHIRKTGRPISMLVASNKSTFIRKATGKITFVCSEGGKIKDAIDRAIETGEGQTFWMTSTGTNEMGEQVSGFEFEWTIKLKQTLG